MRRIWLINQEGSRIQTFVSNWSNECRRKWCSKSANIPSLLYLDGFLKWTSSSGGLSYQVLGTAIGDPASILTRCRSSKMEWEKASNMSDSSNVLCVVKGVDFHYLSCSITRWSPNDGVLIPGLSSTNSKKSAKENMPNLEETPS